MATYQPTRYMTARASAVSGDALGAGLERLAFGFLFGLVLLLPSEEHFPLLGGFLLSRWLATGALGLTVLQIIASWRLRKPGALHYLMLAWVAWAGVSLFWSLDRDGTTSRIGTYLQLMLMVWMIWVLAATAERVRSLLVAYLLGSSTVALSTIQNFFSGRNLAVDYADRGVTAWDTSRYAANGINANDLSLLLAFSVPIALYLLARSGRAIVVCLCWVHIGMASLATLLTGSRGGMISLAVAFSMYLPVMPVMPKLRRRLSILLMAAVLAGSASQVPPETWGRLMRIGAELSEGTMTHRTQIWSAGWELFRDRPFTGIGAGAYAASVRRQLDIAIVAHNTFLSVLVELGVIGAVLLVLLLLGMFYSATGLPYLEKWLWIVLLVNWMVGVSALTWEYRKATWFLFGMLAAQVGCLQAAVLRGRTR